MNKRDFVRAVSKDSGLTQKVISQSLDSILNTIMRQVAKGEKVYFIGFGSFGPKTVPAQNYTDINTGEKYAVPERKFPHFRSGDHFKETVRNAIELE